MMLVVISGFAVRYLLTYVNHEITDKLLLLHAKNLLDAFLPGPLSDNPHQQPQSEGFAV
jgi:hypothetical protein